MDKMKGLQTATIEKMVFAKINNLNNATGIKDAEEASNQLTRIAKELRARHNDSEAMGELARYGF